jgi:hypothetical protein
LRNPSIAADSGISTREERSAKAGRRSGPKNAKAAPFWRRAFEGKRGLRRLLMLGFGAAVAIGVPVNALWLQEGPHPAPLFHFGAPQPDAKTATLLVKDAPLPRPRPASLGVAASEPAPAAKTEATKPLGKSIDAIAQLIGGGVAKSDAGAKDKSVVFAQRALAKLGYPLHQDGVFGGTTRQAVEKFERANGMPVTGELSQKILRKLSAKSGVALR